MFSAFLSRSLTLLSNELPWVDRALCRALGSRVTALTVDGEKVTVRSDGSVVRVTAAIAEPDVECVTSRTTILALIDARLTILEAIDADQLWLRGGVGDLIAFHEGLSIYVSGAVRSPSFPRLLQEYRIR
jgi:hypothetical protein